MLKLLSTDSSRSASASISGSSKDIGIVIKDSELIEQWTNKLSLQDAYQIGFIEITLEQFQLKNDYFNLVEFLQKLIIYQVKPKKIIIHLDPEEDQKFTNKNVFELVDLLDLLSSELEQFAFGIPGWGIRNNKITDEISYKLSIFISHLRNLKELKINLFENGLENSNVTGNTVLNIMSAIKTLNKEKLQKISLNFGRLGCNQYSSIRCLKPFHLTSITKALEMFPNLTYISLNLRSWGYQNPTLGDEEIKQICDIALQKKTVLTQLHLNLYMWGYKNQKVTSKGVYYISETIRQLPKLISLGLQLRRFENVEWCDLQYMGLCISTLRNLRGLNLNTELWRFSKDKENSIGQQQVHDFLAYVVGRRFFWNQKRLFIQYKMDVPAIQGQPAKSGVLDLKPYKIANAKRQNELLFISQIQNQYQNKYRKEMIHEILEVCFLKDEDQMGNIYQEFKNDMKDAYKKTDIKNQYILGEIEQQKIQEQEKKEKEEQNRYVLSEYAQQATQQIEQQQQQQQQQNQNQDQNQQEEEEQQQLLRELDRQFQEEVEQQQQNEEQGQEQQQSLKSIGELEIIDYAQQLIIF